MRIALRFCAPALLALFIPATAPAQPANDLFANRILLTGAAVSTSGSNVGATTESGEPLGGYFPNRGATVWFRWTAPATGTARFDTFGSTFNTYLGVFTGNAVNSLSQVAVNDNAPGAGDVSLIITNVQAGTTYQIQIGGARAFAYPQPPAATGAFQLHLGMPPTVSITSPANGSIFVRGSNITVTASASSPNGPVTRVDFFAGTNLFSTVTTTPYTAQLSSAPPGSNSLYVVVTDTTSQVTTSAVVNIFVANLGVTLTSPRDGAAFINTNPILVGFNVGVELGQLAIVAVFLPIAFTLCASWFYRTAPAADATAACAGTGETGPGKEVIPGPAGGAG